MLFASFALPLHTYSVIGVANKDMFSGYYLVI